MANKRAQHDNPAGYGHGGMGWDPSLDAMPQSQPQGGNVPSWLPWAGLAGAGLLGYAGLKGLGRVFRRGTRGAATAAKSPIPLWERELLGRESPAIQRAINDSTESIAGHGLKMSSVLPALGRIARGE
jgi:hypothetical protein